MFFNIRINSLISISCIAMSLQKKAIEYKCEASAVIFCSALSFSALCLLWVHFLKRNVECTQIKITAIAPTLLTFLFTIPGYTLLNPSLFPAIRHRFNPILSKGCNTFMRIDMTNFFFIRYLITVFFISRLRYFISTTSQLKKPTYYGSLIALTMCETIVLWYVILNVGGTIHTASDDMTIKICELMPSDIDAILMMFYLFCECIAHSILLYLFYTNDPNRYVVKRTVALGIASTFSLWISVLLSLWIAHIRLLIKSNVIFQILCILSSFDIALCGNSNETPSMSIEWIELQRVQRRETYLRNIMDEYYRVPVRRIEIQIPTHSNTNLTVRI
eukprot:824322_1